MFVSDLHTRLASDASMVRPLFVGHAASGTEKHTLQKHVVVCTLKQHYNVCVVI